MHPARWSVFFSLLGLTALIPAYFVPAMLVANAVDGSRWFSVWTGITTFWERGHWFLAGLIFCFSFLFPLVKFSLSLLCAAGGRWLPRKFRHGVFVLTQWTAKYSMLDVFVIALLVLLVKVKEYIRMLPSLGLYLFSFAVLCSVLAGGALNRAIQRDPEMPSTTRPRKRRVWPYLPWLIASVAVAACGAVLAVAHTGGRVNRIVLTNLTKRPVPRSMEKFMGLKELTKEEHRFWSMDTWTRFKELLQAATTDIGLNDPQGFLVVETIQGSSFETPLVPVNFDDPDLKLEFALPQELELKDVGTVIFKTRAEYVKLVPVDNEEERLSAANDPFRTWNPEWYGRIFKFTLSGPAHPEFMAGILIGITGLLGIYWAGSGLLCGGKSRQPRADRQAEPRKPAE
ncbi:MAG: paraquat-inducible protein A [Verrucomicrobiales bacterium]|nr:paraquat-inducible protein A [Verrucomicrobiales bacterium]